MRYDLSIILPGIRPQNWENLYNSAVESVKPFSFEIIAVGPNDPPESLKNKENFKFFRDFGCPSRCVQFGSTHAEAKYICWMSDDGLYQPQALAQCINTFETQLSIKDGITFRYFEGEGNGTFPDEYWRPRHHESLRLPGIKEEYNTASLGMYCTDNFRWIGGLDCSYEHINMCTHDLAFRIQNNGGKIILSPSLVARFYWSWITNDSGPVQQAFFQNDLPLFQKMWSQDQSNRIQIDYNNWKNSPEKWSRRFA